MEEQKQLLNILMRELEGKDKITEEQATRLFNLNNNIYPEIQEHNRSCPACRERVFNRMKRYWEVNVKNDEQ